MMGAAKGNGKLVAHPAAQRARLRKSQVVGIGRPTSGAVTVHNVQVALEALGIEFLNHERPGVRLSVPSERTAEIVGAQRPRTAAKTSRRKAAKGSLAATAGTIALIARLDETGQRTKPPLNVSDQTALFLDFLGWTEQQAGGH